jgi:adenylate kinase family enzyme
MTYRSNLVVIRGLPGSGKSTAAQKLIKAGYTFLEADMYHINKKTGAYEFDIQRKTGAWEWVKETIANLLMHGQDVVLAGVFPTNNTLQLLKDNCRYIGASFTVLTAESDHGNIHDVPEEVLAGMLAAWEPLDLK